MMRPTPTPALLFVRAFAPLCLLLCGLAQAQAPASPASAPATASTAAPKTAIEQTIQHIHVEDASLSIDELRVGGETKSINVEPKGGMPSYQVAPATGERTWKVLGF